MEKEIIDMIPQEEYFKYFPISADEIDFAPSGFPKELTPTFTISQMSHKDKFEFNKLQVAINSLSSKMVESMSKAEDIENIDELIDSLGVTDSIHIIDLKMTDILRKYVKGWTNFKSIDSKKVFKFSKDKKGDLSKACFAKIPNSMVTLLTNEILKISGLTDYEDNGLKS